MAQGLKESAGEDFSLRVEALSLAFLALMAFVTLSLVSHHAEDPSLLTFNYPATTPQNWMGAIGAHLSVLLFFLLGKAAYLIPMEAVLYAFLTYWLRKKIRLLYFVSGIASFTLATAFFFAMASLPSLPNVLALPDNSGGIIGSGLKQFFLPALGKGGSCLFFLLIIGISYLLVAQTPLRFSLQQWKNYIFFFKKS